ncbi:MAG: M48 family metallopeptidase [Sterolibacterium sp.]|jgi:predicted metal-dependent hydrolase|nr:M48 family metallopeptidase [Sterolibacterium sp.]
MSLFPRLEALQLDLFGFAVRPPPVPKPAPTAAVRQRYIQLGQRIVAYTLRQGQRRQRVALRIDERGLSVGAPGRASLASIEAFIQSHADWVLAKLDEQANQQRERQLRIQDGACLPLLGEHWPIRIVAGEGRGTTRNRSHWHDDHLLLEVSAGAGSEEHAHLVRRALQTRALAVFAERLAHYAQRIGHPPPPLRLSSARTRWGSCSLNSGIRINWRLIHLPLPLIDYVIAHELAHLLEMNHSPRFWAVVAQIYPDWAAARSELQRRGKELPLL